MSINNYIIDKIMYSNKNNINNININTVNNKHSNSNNNNSKNNNKNNNKNNDNNDNKINIKQYQISVIGGKKISSNIFDSKLKNKEIFNDIIPLVNSLFNIYITNFTFLQQQSLFLENNELKITKDMSNNHTYTSKQYMTNKLTNFKIFENVLIKCKIQEIKNTINFNNIKNYNYITNFNIITWKLLDDINIILKYNTTYYCIELNICSNKEISNNKYKKLNYIVDNFIKLLLYIQKEK